MAPENSAHTEVLPRKVQMGGVWIIASLLFIVVGLVVAAKLTERPVEAVPISHAILEERVIFLEGTRAGAVQMRNEVGQIIASWEADDAGFVSTLARVIKRERQKRNISSNSPITLRRRDGDIPTIFDPQTGHEIYLNSFGVDNVSQVLSLFTARPTVSQN